MSDLPVVDSDVADSDSERGSPLDPVTDGSRVAGVLLAAGLSTRFEDDNKLLATLEGRPVVVHAAETLLAAGLPVVAVLGHDARRVGRALRSLDDDGRLALVGNPDYHSGQSSSVRTGVRAAWNADAAVFALGDMPGVDPRSVRRLLSAYRGGAGDALAAAVDGRRGNPVLFDAGHFPELLELSGDRGGRAVLLASDRAALVETGDPGVRRDVDTGEDLDQV